MKPYLPLTLAIACALTSGALAQTVSSKQASGNVQLDGPSTAAPSSSGSTPDADSTVPTPVPLQISEIERDYFEMGYSLSKAAFGYADIAKQSVQIQKGKDRMQQIKLLAGLAPAAERDRLAIRESLNQTVFMMRTLGASKDAFLQVTSAADDLNRPLVVDGGAKDLAALSPDAGKTLASLNEFERISGLTQSPEIATWLKGRHQNRVGNVWYAEGMIAGVAEVASAQDMPELLPTVGEIATDLRGLRDWLVLRMPDPPSTEQTALSSALDDFLNTSSQSKRQDRPVTSTELVALGSISRQLQTQVLLESSANSLSQTTGATAGQSSARLADVKKPL